MRNAGLQVFTESDGQVLGPEYQVEVADEKTMSCYIANEVGKVCHSYAMTTLS